MSAQHNAHVLTWIGEVARINAYTAHDQRRAYDGAVDAKACYLINTLDTLTDHGVRWYRELAVALYLAAYKTEGVRYRAMLKGYR